MSASRRRRSQSRLESQHRLLRVVAGHSSARASAIGAENTSLLCMQNTAASLLCKHAVSYTQHACSRHLIPTLRIFAKTGSGQTYVENSWRINETRFCRRHWHSDWPHDIGAGTHSGHVSQPFPDVCMALSTVWYLTDVGPYNGSTMIVPGSHKDLRNPRGAGKKPVSFVHLLY
jgi:ectoine hydroxylase-related dioxygenase (phytanoyl-CoA dioxygenase family)